MTVVFIAGAMRSGTTALGQALTASPDAVLVGELRATLLGAREPGPPPCDCGKPEEDCPFWSAVDAPATLAADVAASYRTLRIPALFLSALGLTRPTPADLAVVAALRGTLTAAGGRTVVDTSKSAAGILLWRLAGERVVVARCVRSPRVVARKQAAARSGLPHVSRTASSAAWAVHHLATLLAGLLPGVEHRTVGYRRLVDDPGATVRDLWRRAGVRPGAPDGPRFTLGTTHALVGNPRRERGTVLTIAARRPPTPAAAPPVASAGEPHRPGVAGAAC